MYNSWMMNHAGQLLYPSWSGTCTVIIEQQHAYYIFIRQCQSTSYELRIIINLFLLAFSIPKILCKNWWYISIFIHVPPSNHMYIYVYMHLFIINFDIPNNYIQSWKWQFPEYMYNTRQEIKIFYFQTSIYVLVISLIQSVSK